MNTSLLHCENESRELLKKIGTHPKGTLIKEERKKLRLKLRQIIRTGDNELDLNECNEYWQESPSRKRVHETEESIANPLSRELLIKNILMTITILRAHIGKLTPKEKKKIIGNLFEDIKSCREALLIGKNISLKSTDETAMALDAYDDEKMRKSPRSNKKKRERQGYPRKYKNHSGRRKSKRS